MIHQAKSSTYPLSSKAASIYCRYTLYNMNAAIHIYIYVHTMYDDISITVINIMLRQFDQ